MSKVAFWKHFPVSDQNAKLLAEETLHFQSKLELDLIKITPAGTWLATCYGLVDIWENDFLGRRVISQRCVHAENDWLNLPSINEQVNLIDVYIETAGILQQQKFTQPIFTTVFCPVSQAIQMAGIDRFREHLKSAPAKVLKGLEKITENTIDVLKRFADAGVEGNYFVTQAMQKSVLPEPEYVRYAQSFDTECLKQSLKLFQQSIFHLHGEGVYFNIDPSVQDVLIHFEFDQSALFSNSLKNELLPGIKADLLKSVNKESEAVELIKTLVRSISNPIKTLTAGCVLPLDFPDEQVLFWKKIMLDNF